MSISARKIINAPDFLVDPRLVLPPGVANTGYTEALEDTAGQFTDASIDVSGTEVISGIGDAIIPSNNNMPVPDSMIIIAQTIRIVPGGGIVVDVEVEVNDINNIQTYDVRLAKL